MKTWAAIGIAARRHRIGFIAGSLIRSREGIVRRRAGTSVPAVCAPRAYAEIAGEEARDARLLPALARVGSWPRRHVHRPVMFAPGCSARLGRPWRTWTAAGSRCFAAGGPARRDSVLSRREAGEEFPRIRQNWAIGTLDRSLNERP